MKCQGTISGYITKLYQMNLVGQEMVSMSSSLSRQNSSYKTGIPLLYLQELGGVPIANITKEKAE